MKSGAERNSNATPRSSDCRAFSRQAPHNQWSVPKRLVFDILATCPKERRFRQHCRSEQKIAEVPSGTAESVHARQFHSHCGKCALLTWPNFGTELHF